MAKEKSTDPERAARKAEKKAKKEAAAAAAASSTVDAPEAKRSTTDGVHKSSKKDKAAKAKAIEAEIESVEATSKLLNQLEEKAPGSVVTMEKEGGDGEKSLEVRVKRAPLIGALVPFANPLAEDKTSKKVLKSVKKANKNRVLKRGVKEVVKAVRKSPTTTTSHPFAVVILAADISPMDVISHIPVLCEDHHIPYIFVNSRVELGAASMTKRPTSVVMINRDKGSKGREKEKKGKKGGDGDDDKMDVDGGEGEGKGKGAGDGDGEEDWVDTYAELVKVVVKAGRGVRI